MIDLLLCSRASLPSRHVTDLHQPCWMGNFGASVSETTSALWTSLDNAGSRVSCVIWQGSADQIVFSHSFIWHWQQFKYQVEG